MDIMSIPHVKAEPLKSSNFSDIGQSEEIESIIDKLLDDFYVGPQGMMFAAMGISATLLKPIILPFIHGLFSILDNSDKYIICCRK